MKMIISEEAKKIWSKIAKDGQIEEKIPAFEIHKKILNIFHVGDFYYFIFDVKNSGFEYISPEMNTLLGYPPSAMSIDFFLSSIHPEDQPWFLNFENALHKFFRTLPIEKIPDYKVRYDFRFKTREKGYIRILHQLVILQNDEKGNLLRSLGIHTDITHLKSAGKPVLSFIGMNNEPSYINVDAEKVFKPSKDVLSNREKEILRELINGNQSKEIAANLNISRETVDKHRRNMMTKTGVSTSSQLIAQAIREGWI
ncbi:MAG: LuxR C-terminal-related transcriptional regulator [Chitinophagaceae bacterium]